MVDERDALQEILVALEFGRTAGWATHDAYESHKGWFDEHANIYPYRGVKVTLSAEAAELMRKASAIMDEQEESIFEITDTGSYRYDMRKAVE